MDNGKDLLARKPFFKNIMNSTTKENAGGLYVDDCTTPATNRPDLEMLPALGDKFVEELIGDTMETEQITGSQEDNQRTPTDQPMEYGMNTIQASEVEIAYRNLFEVLKNRSNFKLTIREKENACINYCIEHVTECLNQEGMQFLEKECKLFVKRVAHHLKTRNNEYRKVEEAMRDTLDTKLQISTRLFSMGSSSHEIPCSSSSLQLRPKETPKSTHRKNLKRVAETLPHQSPSLLVKVAARQIHASGRRLAARRILDSLCPPTNTKKVLEPTNMSPAEALAMLLDLGLTKAQYKTLRSTALQHNCHLYPAYDEIRRAKYTCRPPKEDLVSTETMAAVPLQSLLDHTAKRIIEYCEPSNLSEFAGPAKLICSWGFDGSSGHSNYKQNFQNPSQDDSSLFATTVIPLALVSATSKFIWSNPTPQSIRFCRPLKLEYIKETTDAINKEHSRVLNEASNLEVLDVSAIVGYPLCVSYDLHMTLIDGKVFSAIADVRSALTCQLCGISSSKFNNIAVCKVAPVRKDMLKHGLSPLHAWIRSLEFLLHLSYKLPVRKWRITDPLHKQIVQERKNLVQRQLKETLSIIVDMPKPGGFGSTNDGNTARRAFANSGVFARILGIEEKLVQDIRTLLITLNCQLPVNVERFGAFCDQLAAYYVSKYPWFYMSPTIHKLLIHGRDIIEKAILPIGYFGEEAAESRNKFYKEDRKHHARKTSRQTNIEDVFWRAMDTSDPLMSMAGVDKSLRKLKKAPLPKDVIFLLKELDPIDDDHNDPTPYDVLTDFDLGFLDIALEHEVSTKVKAHLKHAVTLRNRW